MSTFTVSKRFSFEAAHSLPHLPADHKCSRLHGHSYVFEVFCTGPVDMRGFVVDYAEISEAVEPLIKRKLDHQFLNATLENELPGGITSAENIAAWLLETLRRGRLGNLVSEVRLYETVKTCVRVTP